MYKLEAKKSLGQNFLHNKTMIRKIAEAGEISADELIIEIGPGTGELTAGILEEIKKADQFDRASQDSQASQEADNLKNTAKNKGAVVKKSNKLGTTRLIAIEKDQRAIPILEERFKEEVEAGILQIIEGDFLEMDLETLISGRIFKIIANIPYYITGAIIRKSLELQHKPSKLIFLVQKEVAERIVERDGKGSILSKSIAFFGKPRLILAVAKGNFVPSPKVDSAVVSITISEENLKNLSTVPEKWFFEILHAGFAHKRKILTSNLKQFFADNKVTQTPEEIFLDLSINPKIRAEELSIEDWISISKSAQNFIKK